MASVEFYGTERERCTDPDEVGCNHELAIHGAAADGCSHIGSSGWCLCSFVPERTGAAGILHDVITQNQLSIPSGPSDE